jgi:predicted MFS family arabinose efflux permease
MRTPFHSSSHHAVVTGLPIQHPPHGGRQRPARILNLAGAGRRLALMALIDAVGTGGFMSVSVAFLSRWVGLRPDVIAVGLSLAGAVALLTAVPIGALADRYGARLLLMVVSLVRAVLFCFYPLLTNVGEFLALVCALGMVDRASSPLLQVLVGEVVNFDNRVRTMALMRSVRNVGFAAGTALGGLALAADTFTAYAVVLALNAASFAVFGLQAAGLRGSGRRPSSRALRDRPFLVLTALNAILTLHIPLLGIGIPLLVVHYSEVPRTVIALLLGLNMVVAVVFQVPSSRSSRTPEGAACSLRLAGVALAVCSVLLAAVPSLPVPAAVALLFLAVLALTVGELYQSAGGWGLSYDLADAEERSAYLSVFWLGTAVGRVIAPGLLASVLALGVCGWGGMAVAFIAAGVVVPGVARWAMKSGNSECRVVEPDDHRADRQAGPRRRPVR